MANSVTSTSQKTYDSPFKNWDKSSWIRSKPLRELSFSGLLFSPELTPLASHPEISKDPALYEAALAYRLLEHLQFTSLVELNYVNPVCSDLFQGKTIIKLTEEQRFDLLKIYCDEGGHSLFMKWFLQQVENYCGLSHSVLGQPQFELNFQKLLDAEDSLSPNLIKLFLTNVIETLYVRAYSSIPQDQRIAPAVRTVIGDHIADEAKHYTYFFSLFPLLWNSLSNLEQEKMGQFLPRLMRTFLEPNQIAARNVLQNLGFSAVNSEGILQEIYVPEKITQTTKRAAQPALKMFKESGLFSISSVKKAFEDYGFLV
ncbi:diiron oxygenase [Crocosphaera sp.]|uniref:diiron oxygenase n=1 Tax=Crocosphaera sp. TaxID=2729996 RepID=UPI003F25C1EB